MLIDSSSECTESTSTKDENFTPRSQGLFNISTIQLFIYLIAPLADVITEEEVVDNIRLESGLKIWQAIWQFRQPDVWCFSAPVKQRRDELPQISFARRQNPMQSQNQGIYLGKEEKPRRPSIVPPPKPPRTDAAVLHEKRKLEEEKEKQRIKMSTKDYVAIEIDEPLIEKPGHLLIDMTPVTASGVSRGFQRTSSIVRSVSEYKTNLCGQKPAISKSQTSDAFDVSPTSDSSAKMLEEVEEIKFAENENCSLSAVFFSADQAPLVNLSDICSGFSLEADNIATQMPPTPCPTSAEQSDSELGYRPVDNSMYLSSTSNASDAPPFILTRASTTDETASSCSQQTVIPIQIPVPSPTVAQLKTLTPAITTSKTENRRTDHQRLPSSQKSVSGSTDDELDENSFNDPTVASYLDVAVIRALLITHWQEKGVYWALRYILNRLEEIQVYVTVRQGARQRSNSLPSGERKLSVAPDQFTNPTWDDLKYETKEEGRAHLHVAFNDSERRKSSDNCLAPHTVSTSRRSSLNTMSRRGINRSNPSLNNSVEVLSIRDDAEDDISNISTKSVEKENSKINAAYFPEALGSTNFIEKDGKVSATVIVQTVNQVMDRCTGVRQCELALNIADVLLRTPLEQTETFFVQLNIMVFKIYLCLGCPHGCNEGVKSQHGDFLRAKARSILAHLERVQPEKFKTILNDYVDNYGTQQVIDLLHSITAFCRSELAPVDGRRSSESRMPSYRNTFNEKDKGIEGRIINATYKTLITKVSAISAELTLPENMSLQQDVRMLVNFVQDHHGNPFRRVGLSALKDAIGKSPIPGESNKEDNSSPGGASLKQGEKNDQASLRRGLFKKKEKSGGTTTGNDDSEGDSSPSTPRTVSSMDDGVSPLASNNTYKKKSAPKLHFAFGLLKSVRPDMDEETSDQEMNEDQSQQDSDTVPMRRPLRQSSKHVKARLPIDYAIEDSGLNGSDLPIIERSVLERQAGRYFYQWGIQIGEHLCKMVDMAEKKNRKALQMEDAIEDFFDDGVVNDAGGERCPPALQFIAVLLLQEITAFLRETFKTIPRSKNSKPQTGNSGWDKLLSHRRWSILSNTFNAQQTGSVNSITDINSSIHLNDKERRISLSAAEEDSPRGSKDAIDEINAVDKKGRRIATGRQRLLKRGTPMTSGATGQPSLESSHKRKSFRSRKQSKPAHMEEEEKSDGAGATHILSARDSLKPTDDGLQSPVETVHPTVIPHSNHGSSHSQQPVALKPSIDDEEQHMLSNLPWIKVLIKFSNSFDLECQHDGACTPKCFQRIHRQCYRLIESLSTLYGAERNARTRTDKRKLLAESWQSKQQALRRSIHARQSTAVPRRESAMVGQPEFASKAIKMMLMEKMQQEKEKEKEKEKEEKEALKKQSVEQDRHSEDTEEEQTSTEKNKQMLSYLRSLVLQLVHSPISSVLKCCLLLNVEQHKQMIGVSWKMLQHEDPHVVASAASMFIVASVKRSEDGLAMIRCALESPDAQERTSGIQRFYTLWRNRFHAWLKMEDGAQAFFKVPPPGIDFTLPSPAIGQSQLPVVDPPWMPHLKTKIEELSLKEEEHATSQTIMTMTRTRRKQKQEMVKRAVREAEERQCEQRQLFRLRSSAIVSLAAYEPALFHHQQEQTEESENSHQHARHVMPVAQPLFPSALLSVVPQIIELLDDPQVDKNGVSEVLMSQLRKLVLRFHPLPSQAAHSLLNYLFGFVMHYVRTQCEGSEKAIGMALSICWLLSPNIHGLYFKDLKQTLRKEQCDQALMITANVPSAKKIIVHGLDSGSGGIPSQFPVHEDTQFHQILSDSLEFFNIEEDDMNSFYLTDTKTGVIHLPAAYVRDYYFFHRSFYPQLTLVRMSPEVAHKRMKDTAFHQRFIEVGKVLLTHNILKYSPQHVIAQRVFFLHDEFTHLPSFPRKSLETCFGMYYGPSGEQLKAMEAMHKFVWAKLMSDMFEKMENAFMFADLHLFINVINGIMIMHCEDVLILRRCAATYISISIHFSTLFASQGFFLIMPTLLRCYSQRQTNKVFCQVVEFICRQFYTLHRKPFLLQMCGAIANIIDNSSNDFEINPMRVKAKYWFYLIKKMEEITDEDPLDILGLVPYEKPLRALDLCYRDDPNTFCVLTDAMASCICVCAFSPESKRSHHMLLIMQAMLPHMMKRLEEDTLASGNSPSAVKHEISQWITMAVEMKALINSCEQLVRGPTRAFDLVNSVSERGKSFVADSPQFFDPPTTNDDENSRPYHLKEKRSTAVAWEAVEVEEQQKEAYRRPRDTLLQLIAVYIETAAVRLKELTKLGANLEHAKIPDVLDHKCYVKLGEVALALLKVAPYDLATTTCHGLQKYFQSILPVTDWSIESNRSALNIILRRLDKTLSKIAKRQSFRKRAIWIALSAWINGICDTLNSFPYIAHLHPLKTITQLCLRMMVGDPCVEDGSSSTALHPSTVLHPTPPPQIFANGVLRLTTILMQALGQFAFSLDFVTSTEGMGVSSERLEAVLCHVLIPLFLRIPNNMKEQSIFQSKDLAQCLTVMQNAISPPLAKQPAPPLISTSTLTTSFIRGTQDVTGRQGSVSVTDRGHSATVSTHRIVRESICQSIYLGLKVLMLIFGKLLAPMWPRVARLVKDLLAKKPGAPSALIFVDFLLHSNLPIALFIIPMIQNKMKQKPGSEQEAAWQSEILEKLNAKHHNVVPMSILIIKCSQELQQLKEELSMKPIEMARSYTPTMADPHSDSSAASTAPRGATSRQSIDRKTSIHAKKMLPTMKEDSTIPEDVEDETCDNLQEPPSTSGVPSPIGRMIKSSSIPLNKGPQSSRTRSISGFGMWRSVRRKSRHISTDDSSDDRGSVELHDIAGGHHSTLQEPNRTPNRRSTEALVLPLHESIDTNRHRFVSFSTPKKSHERDEEVFQITEQHQLV
ncbi:unnamed protein product [Caenorhabditis sp. 36 PRJEB53466]|nr:unnamed protein product [Caenorhabditis sp. 36 PRJEB53466]